MGKESFLLYKSFKDPLEFLSDEDSGKLFKAIMTFQCEGIDPDLTQKTQWVILYLVAKNQFLLDAKKYEKIVERNTINGSKGGRKRQPSGTQKTQWVKNNPVGADNDNDINTTLVVLHPLQEWLKKECPRVCKLDNPITSDEAAKILLEFKDKDKIKKVFLAMNNKKTLLKDYVSAYRTFRQWILREEPQSQSSKSNTLNISPKSNSGSAL